MPPALELFVPEKGYKGLPMEGVVARPGRLHVSGLDISHTFVEIAREHARQAGVSVGFRQ